MNKETKKEKIKSLVSLMLNEVHNSAIAKIDELLDSGAIDIDAWVSGNNDLVTPKAMVIAILKSEASQYSAKGTSFEKRVIKEVNNMIHFL